MKRIDTLDEWAELYKLLKRHGYVLWQMQYRISDPEGFHARFSSQGRSEVEIVTFDEKVYKAIIRYEKA